MLENDQAKIEANKKFAAEYERLKEIYAMKAMKDLNIEIENERLQLIDSVESYLNDLSVDIQKSFNQFLLDKHGAPGKENREKLQVEAQKSREEGIAAKLAKQKKIREGISNPEAEEYVKNLVKENNQMKRELVLAKFENQALKANNDELVSKIEKEAQEMNDYLSSVQNVFSVFSEKIKSVYELHKVVEETNDSGSSKQS